MRNNNIIFNIPTGQTNQEAPEVIIKVIGVGGGGGNAVANMYKQGIKDVSFAICNTDRQILKEMNIPTKIQLGPGLGAGGDPELGKKYAEESIEKIKTELFNDGTHMVFITAGMGGGTGTGAAPVIANVARSMGILTVGIVTIPFLFELRPRIANALKGVQELSKNVDTLLVINNERLFDIYTDCEMPTEEAFKHADDILTIAAKSIAEIITVTGIINRDFSDVNTTMKNGGKGIVTTGIAKGTGRVEKAIKNALHSPLLQDNDIQKAHKMLFVLYSSSEHPITISEMAQMDTFVKSLQNKNIEFPWGLYKDETLDENVKITIIATGFDEQTDNTQEHQERIDELIDKYYGKNRNNKKDAPIIPETDNNKPETDGKEPVENVQEDKPTIKDIRSRIADWINQFLGPY